MTDAALVDVIRTYSHANGGAIATAERELFSQHWLKDLIPLLVQAFPSIKRSAGRIAILARLLRSTRDCPDVVPLAIGALSDRAYLVRELACSILAYSLRRDVIPSLQSVVERGDPKTCADAMAAIDAIAHQNHHYYVDRQHTGHARWIVKPSEPAEGSNSSPKPKPPGGSA
ncbi:hypothetical protein [Montanilutibacter psychrotolerans]|uniref:HEAT repeat domain-containing protein n=1 Tax=Montanilutibacter psychrotolerans TaxID=1327343 RepID=A0A3M8SSM8_9GAMM|nr:hypothetical protein [Lysobacter psychrotolerans]RNF82224.1 hypothetical protein EER27_15010 [Lysobacter psychrotolerans]